MGSCLSSQGDTANELEAELDRRNELSVLPSNHLKGTLNSPTPASKRPPVLKRQGSNTHVATAALMAPSSVKLLSGIGRGISGIVFKGNLRGSLVAVKKIKTIPMDNPKRRQEIEAALTIESDRMASLRHPNILLFMGAMLKDDLFCIVSEYSTRGSLFDVLYIKEKPASRGRQAQQDKKKKSNTREDSYLPSTMHDDRINWTIKHRLVLGAARGLVYLHTAEPPLVHSQIKSTNIMVDDSWNAKLSDFGTRRVASLIPSNSSVARAFDTREGLDPKTNTPVMGHKEAMVLRWTAPELLKLGADKAAMMHGPLPGASHPEAVDVYSLGMVMWEVTSHTVPFPEVKTTAEVAALVLAGVRPTVHPKCCSLKWAQVMLSCWAADPNDRPSASNIVSILESMTV